MSLKKKNSLEKRVPRNEEFKLNLRPLSLESISEKIENSSSKKLIDNNDIANEIANEIVYENVNENVNDNANENVNEIADENNDFFNNSFEEVPEEMTEKKNSVLSINNHENYEIMKNKNRFEMLLI